jgi:pimeloyl-ACP methyl ester carboxylesterase
MLQKIKGPNDYDLAYVHHAGNAPTLVFLGGYKSDMEGTKAIFLEELAQKHGYGFLRFDYGGHGLSGGDFKAGTIGSWGEDALFMIDNIVQGDAILAGSSMGGWIALLCAFKRPERVRGLIGIAAAPDFTTWIENQLTEGQKQDLDQKGYFEEPNDYSDEPYIFTKKLLQDGRTHALLDKSLALSIPVRLVQGKKDADVPWETAEKIKKALQRGQKEGQSPDISLLYVEEGDHRLSRPQDLELLGRTFLDLAQNI